MEKALGVSEFCRPTTNRSGIRSMAENMPLDGHFGDLCVLCVCVCVCVYVCMYVSRDFIINYFQAS